ncbi:S66 family peptidase [Marinithermus hydrothermalis]|uniref:S66 family peptidase n=1 Tax=Marinithermus hydrothermalis TaxID=186192 RepID=UPI0003105D7D|nr:S66 peptidase family protein [Marinithermus hydrothermalis]
MGVVSPSAPTAHHTPRRFKRSVAHLQRLGFRVKVGPHTLNHHHHTAGTVEERLEDLHAMFADPEVKGILCTIGGHNANALLEGLDYALIQNNPKVFLGYSDITALHLGMHTQTGLVTFLGPALLPQFGEADGLHPYTRRYLEAVLIEGRAPLELEPSEILIHEHLLWDEEDNRPRRAEPHPGPKVLRPGTAQGPVIAGNLGTMLALCGTPFFPNLEGAILCVEEDETESPASVDRFLTQLRLMGAFAKIRALLVGRFHPKVGFGPEDPLEAVLLRATAGYDLPVAYGFDFGHTDPMFTLPIGTQARVAFGTEARVWLLEPAVSV